MINNGETINHIEQMSSDINGIGIQLYFLSFNIFSILFGNGVDLNF